MPVAPDNAKSGLIHKHSEHISRQRQARISHKINGLGTVSTRNRESVVVPRPSVNVSGCPARHAFGARGAFLAPAALRLRDATMALRSREARLPGTTRLGGRLPGAQRLFPPR